MFVVVVLHGFQRCLATGIESVTEEKINEFDQALIRRGDTERIAVCVGPQTRIIRMDNDRNFLRAFIQDDV